VSGTNILIGPAGDIGLGKPGEENEVGVLHIESEVLEDCVVDSISSGSWKYDLSHIESEA